MKRNLPLIVKWSLMAVIILSLAACGSSSNKSDTTPPTAQELAIEIIASYAQNGNTPPTIQDYENAGVTGVNATNLAQINTEVLELTYDDVDTKDEIQILIDGLEAVVVAPSLESAPSQVFVKGIEIPTLSFTNNANSLITSCIADILPIGLTVSVSSDGSSCEINGIPTVFQAATIHTITASNAEGNDTATVSIEVIAGFLSPSLSEITALTFNKGVSITPLLLSNNGGGSLESCEANNLPDGLTIKVSLDSSSCEITGTPTTVQAPSTTTITATNNVGSDSVDLTISVIDQVTNPVDGNNNNNNNKVELSGIVQKGLFTDLQLEAYVIDDATGDKLALLPVEVTDQEYRVELDPDQTLLLEASGTFLNDVNGDAIILDEPMKVIVDVESQNKIANINLLTTLVAERVLNTLSNGGTIEVLQGQQNPIDLLAGLQSALTPETPLAIDALILQQEGIVNSLFGFANDTQPDQLDYRNIEQGMGIADANVQLLLLSAGVTENITGNELFSGGFDQILDDVVNVSSSAEESNILIPALAVLDNIDAGDVYNAVIDNSQYAYLPAIVFSDSPVFNCIANRPCAWSTQENFTIRVTSDPTYEAEGKLKLVVTLANVSLLPTKINLTTGSDTALDGVDYLGIDEVITIPSGQTSKDVYVDLIIDNTPEQTENFNLNVKSLVRRYTAEQDVVSLSILDGFPAGFDSQSLTKIKINSLEANMVYCFSGSCAPFQSDIESVINDANTLFGSNWSFDPDASVGLIEGNNLLIDVKIGISSCVDQPCSPPVNDLLVNNYLVAVDSSGVQQEELSVGDFIYEKGSTTESTRINISRSEVNAIAINAQENGWNLEFEARLKSPLISSSVSIPSLVPIPDSVVLVDGTEVSLDLALSVSDINCPSGGTGIIGLYGLPSEYDISVGFSELNGIVYGNLCIDFDSINPTGIAATAIEGRLDLLGLNLPAGMGWRAENTDSGIPFITYYLDVIARLTGNNVINPNTAFYLHSEGWPFEFKTDKAYVSYRGIEISYSDMRYIGNVGYSDQDPRKNTELFSNDIYYSGVEGQSGILSVKPEGVSGDFTVNQNQTSSKYSAYPRATIQWQGFSQSIVNNKLQPVTINVSNYQLEQATECSEPGCARDVSQNWQVSASDVKLDGDGFMVGNALNTSNQDVVFGALSGGGFAWSRPNDLSSQQQSMSLASPGYIIPATERVSDYLLAHLEEDESSDDIAKYPLGSDEFIDGNFHPVGLSIGPEIYRNEVDGFPVVGDGQLLLNNNKLTINNGVDSPFELASTAGVKYVLRNSGLTGVFNVSAASLATNANFYGYPLNLSRFAVRATDNQLDDYTWIDGRLALQGDAGGTEGLDIWFSNLEMNCAARLGNVDLLSEACDGIDNNDNGITDENCAPRLSSWKSDTDIFAARFNGNDVGQACAAGKSLFVLDQQLYFKALNKPVVFETQWTAEGNLDKQTSGELPKYRFDKSDEGKGFPIRTKSAKLDAKENYGWLELQNTTLGVTFWNAFAADLQIANSLKGSDIVADPSVAIQASKLNDLHVEGGNQVSNKQLYEVLEGLREDKSEEFDISAIYQWGKTGFGFELPVYYQPHQLDSGTSDENAQGIQSRFLGRKISKDLFVMDANAGINFVEPERTKLSFGASADFERLGNITFQVDISDPESVAEVDDLLLSLNIINTPLLEPKLEGLLGQVDIVNRFASRGLDEVVKEGLQQVFKSAGQISGTDPFVIISEGLAKVSSGPQQAITVIFDEVKTPLQNQVFSVKTLLLGELTALEDFVNDSPDIPKTEVLGYIDQVSSMLGEVSTQTQKVNDTIDGTINRATGVISEVQANLSPIYTAIIDIDEIIDKSLSFQTTICSSGFPTSQVTDQLGYLDKISLRFSKVRELVKTIKGGEEIFEVVEDLIDGSEQERRLDTSKRRIREAITELLGYVETADQAVRDVICEESKVSDVVAKVKALTQRIKGGVDTANSSLTDAKETIRSLTELTAKLDDINKPVNDISSALQLIRDDVENAEIPKSELLTKIDEAKQKIETEFDSASTSINTLINQTRDNLISATNNIIPGAYMSPDQLREMLVTEVMSSGPIKEMRLVMDKHFAEIGSTVNNIVLQYLDQLNFVIKDALAAVTGPVNDALAEATSAIRGIGLNSAGIDGFAVIAGNELERAHIGAEWSMGDDDPTEFRAALDAVSWSAKNKTDEGNKSAEKCGVEDASSLLDVTISAYGLPINIMSSDIEIEKVYLGFTLKQNPEISPALLPIGIFGGISTMGQIEFTDAKVIDPGFVAGLGELQTYIGATSGASFSGLQAEVAFLVGRVCPGNTALTELDPDVAKFLPDMPPSGFAGAYLRGGATIPIYSTGTCFLNIGVIADFGAWAFVGKPTTIGGLVGGGAQGQALCIASLKGKVRVAGSVNTDGDLKLAGEAWGAGGAGMCEPEEWTSVKKSRDDGWCGTGDIETGAVFENGSWDISIPTPSGIH